ncbi:MAG: hypothetical protein OJF50_002010 [Nitrospira sp.]|nr:hypothetical protein [Nitrospira sp.]
MQSSRTDLSLIPFVLVRQSEYGSQAQAQGMVCRIDILERAKHYLLRTIHIAALNFLSLDSPFGVP